MSNRSQKKTAFKSLFSLKGNIDNIFLFISDNVRWDYTPDHLKNKGLCFKTISAGIHTPVSIPSILSGLYPNNHGCFHMARDKMPLYLNSLLNMEGYDISFPGKMNYPIWGENNKDLEEMDPPFIYIEHDHGGHTPYNRETDKSSMEFYQGYFDKDTEDLRQKYKGGVEKSIEIFKERVNYIRDNYDNTLIIFVSDHGELLGEYGGLLGHGWSIFPELVYVPTVFIRPELPSLELQDKVFRHIDLYPTILELLGKSIDQYIDGKSVLKTGFHDKGLTYHKRVKYSWEQDPIEKAVWDYNGGYVFREFSPKQRIQTFLKYTYMMLFEQNDIGLYIRSRLKKKNVFKMFKDFLKMEGLFNRPTERWLSPEFGKEEAISYMNSEIEDMKEKIKINSSIKSL